MERIAIVGSGATAAASHLALRKFAETKQILVVSPDIKDTTSTGAHLPQEKSSLLKLPRDKVSPKQFEKLNSQLANGITGSLDRFGWTQYWGATMLPWSDSSLKGFKQFHSELIEGYEAVNEIIPIQASNDGLQEFFPLYGKNISPKFSSQLQLELERMDLSVENTFVGNSRLAINPPSEDIRSGCTQCGLCLFGCPGNHIWSSQRYFSDASLHFDHIEMYVEKIEVESKVRLVGLDSEGNTFTLNNLDKVILAAGAIRSSSILVQSGIVNQVIVQDSPMTLIPFFMNRKFQKPTESRITLAEAFIVANPLSSSEEQIFAQCYDMNEYIVNKIREKYPVFRLIPNKIFFKLMANFSIAMVFQDHTLGGQISISSDAQGVALIKEWKGIPSNGQRNLKKLVRKLRRRGLYFLWSLRQVARTGEGFHFGNSLLLDERGNQIPISLQNGSIESAPQVHIVDSGSLPSLSCYPTTYTAMANAYRLSRSLCQLTP